MSHDVPPSQGGTPPAASGLRGELSRKLVHVAMGGFALLLRWLGPLEAALLAGVALLFNLLLLHRLTRRGLLRATERARGFSWGIVLYPAAVLALVLVFRERLELAAAGWALLAFGDGMATVVGLLVGGPRLPWNRDKSWAGLVAFVVYGVTTAALLLRFTQAAVLDAARRGGPPAEWIGGSFLDDGAGGSIAAPALLLLAGCLAAALAAGLAESARTGVDDNVLVPLVGGGVLWMAAAVEPVRLVEAGERLQWSFAIGAGINAVLAVAAYVARGVGRSGALVGWLLGTALYGLAGWRGFLMLAAFFVLGTAATRLGWRRKEALGVAQERGGRRGARHALANAGAGVGLAFLAAATPWREVALVGLVAAFATATADTLGSEIGQAWGRRHLLVTTGRRVPPGTDGAVSLEGTLGGLAGAAALAALAAAVGLVGWAAVPVVVLAAGAGSLLESVIGATLERRGAVDNELVNFANTVAGAIVACVLV